ncbi:MAG TPA: RDD family protein [Usitatibacter sp.]|nr:RDD family protein [Usitatibacter sp.]
MIDTLKSVSLPEGAEITLRLAGPLPRALAWFVDFMLRLFLTASLPALFTWLGKAGEGAYFLAIFVMWELYPILFEALWNGATPGKKALGIAVVNADGTPLRWPAAILRNVLRAADMLPIGYMVGLTSMAMDRQFRRLGDLAAGTIVIHREAATPRKGARRGQAQPVRPLAPAIALTALEQRAVLDFAERRATWSAERGEELAGLAAPLVAGLEGPAAVARLEAVAAALVERR